MIFSDFIRKNKFNILLFFIFVTFVCIYFSSIILHPLSFLSGYLGDQVPLFFYRWWTENFKNISGNRMFTLYYGFPFGKDLSSDYLNQPVLWGVYFLLTHLFNDVAVYNYLILLSFFINYIVFYFSYKKSNITEFNSTTGNVLAFLFSTSSYLFLQSKNHLDLLQVWIVPLGLVLFNKYFSDAASHSKSIFNGIKLGIIFCFFIAVSNYISYMLFVMLFIFTLMCFSTRRVNIMFLVSLGISTVFGVVILLLPYIKTSLLSGYYLGSSNISFSRDIFDFVFFSARPWYFFLPSVYNPFIGGFSKIVLNKLLTSNNYLTTHYFAEEHGGSFLGYVNLILLIFTVAKFHKEKKVQKMLVILLVLFVLSMPPVITINLKNYYLPSYILFTIFPMFRVLSRLSIAMLTLILFINSYGLNYIVKKLPKLYVFIFLVLIALNLTEMYIPFKYTDISHTSPAYTYLGEKLPHTSLAVYPYSKTNEALFWIKVHKNKLVNPRDYKNTQYNFDSADFTSTLTTYKGLERLQQLNADNLLVFKKDLTFEDSKFLLSSQKLKLLAEFDDSYLFTVNH